MSLVGTFTGEHQHSLDEKNRVSFPLRLRGCMAEDERAAGFYITLGFEGALLLYPRAVWSGVVERVQSLSATRSESRKFRRVFLAKAQFLTLDRQNRILVPEPLCRLVGIRKEVVFVGVGDHMEVWPKGTYEEFVESVRGEYEELAEKVFRDGGTQEALDSNGEESA